MSKRYTVTMTTIKTGEVVVMTVQASDEFWAVRKAILETYGTQTANGDAYNRSFMILSNGRHIATAVVAEVIEIESVIIPQPEFTKTFASIATGAQFKTNLDNLHSQDLDLFEATDDEAYDAYTARFGEPAECIYFELDFSLWKRQQAYA